MKRAFLLLPVLAVALVLLLFLVPRSASDSAAPEEAIPVVGYVELLSESSWRDELSRSVSAAAESAGLQLLTLECDRTQDAQIQAVRSLITYRVDAIVFTPVVMSGWDNILEEARAAGIPVITVERRVKTDLAGAVAAHIGTNYEAQGQQAALFVMQTFRDAQNPVRIVELQGTVGASSSTERSRGIRYAFGRDDKYDIFYSVSCDLMYSKARETCGIFFTNNRSADVLIAYSDAMALGAMEALEELGIRPGRDILVIAMEGQEEVLALVAEGKVACALVSTPQLGEAVMEAVQTLLRGEQAADVALLGQVVTRETLAQQGESGVIP